MPSVLLARQHLYLISLMLQNLLLSYFCLIFLTCASPAIAQQANSWGGQPSNQASGQNSMAQSNGWQAPQNNQAQSNQQSQVPAQGQWQPNSPPGQWQPLNSNNSGGMPQAGPGFYGNATTTQVNEQYQEPGAYLNQAAPNNAFNDTVSTNSGAPSGQNNTVTTDNTGNPAQQGHAKKGHEGLKKALSGMGQAFETAASVAAPIAGGYMIGKAMSAGYGASPYGYGGMGGYGGMPMSPYGGGYGGMPMSPYGGYGSPYGMGMGGYGMPMMNPGMSSFLHY
jgi:hypothetical protein